MTQIYAKLGVHKRTQLAVLLGRRTDDYQRSSADAQPYSLTHTCEHVFAYDGDGSSYTRLQRAIRAQNLALIHATAAERPYVPLRDALAILLVIDAKDEERFEPAAVRWAGRLALETPDLELAELTGALQSLIALPDEHAQRSLLALAGRAIGRRRRRRFRRVVGRVSDGGGVGGRPSGSPIIGLIGSRNSLPAHSPRRRWGLAAMLGARPGLGRVLPTATSTVPARQTRSWT